MADLDNGLPPEGIDVTDNRISSVNIGRADADNMNINDIIIYIMTGFMVVGVIDKILGNK